MTSIQEKYNSLVKIINCDNESKDIFNLIIYKLLKNNYKNETAYNFSLKISNKKIESVIRFVNFDDQFNLNSTSYEKRIDVIKDILSSCDINCSVLFNSIKAFSYYRLPLQFGAEIIQGRAVFKIYLNFSSIKDNLFLCRAITVSFLKKFNFTPINFKNNIFFGIGVDIINSSVNDYKIYYMYDFLNKNKNINQYNFSYREKKSFDFIKTFRKDNYYCIAEKSCLNNCHFAKIEIKIKENADINLFLDRLLNFYKASLLKRKIMDIIVDTDSRLDVVVIGEDKLVLHMRLQNDNRYK